MCLISNQKIKAQTSFDKVVIFPDSMLNTGAGETRLITTNDNNLIFFCTRRFGLSYSELFISKFDTTGNEIWSSRITGPLNFSSFGVTEMADSSFIVAGCIDSIPPLICSLMHISKNGSIIKASTLSCTGIYLNAATDITSTSDSTIAIAVNLSDGRSGLMVTDLNFNVLSNDFTSINHKIPRGNGRICKLKNGSLIQTVLLGNPNSINDRIIGIFKTDVNGNIIWARQIGDNSFQTYLTDVKEMPAHQIILCGQTQLSNNDTRGIIICLDSTGTIQWSKLYAANILMLINSIIPNDSTSFYAIGFFCNTTYHPRSLFSKININGLIDNYKITAYPNEVRQNSTSTKGPDGYVYSLFNQFPLSNGWLGFALTKFNDSLSICNQLPITLNDSLITLTDSIQWSDTTFNFTTIDITSQFNQYYDSITFLNNCIPTGTNDQLHAEEEKVNVYPNPVSHNISVSIAPSLNLRQNVSLTLYNLYSQIIWTKKYNDYSTNGFEFKLNLDELTNGVYFLEINTTGIKTRRKIIKE